MKNDIHILFVHGNGAPVLYQELHKKISAREPNIWAGMLANSVRKNGFSTAILDCEALALTHEESVEKIHEYRPKIVCFTVYGQNPNASTQNMYGNIKTATLLKQKYPQYKTLFVGNHVIALPGEVLSHECVNMVCTGEGVYAINNLLKVEDLDDEYILGNVKGIGWKDREGLININEYEKIVPQERLEEDLPGVAWDLMPSFDKFRTSPWHGWSNDTQVSPFTSLYTSLGCFAKCGFCMINIINRTKPGPNVVSSDSNIFRHWDPNFIIKQFDYFAEQGVRNIKIADEMFVYKKEHYLELCKLLKERKYNFNIWAYARVQTVKEGYLDLLKDAGINWLGIGIESADYDVRNAVTKGVFKDESIVGVIEKIQSHGLYVGGNYIMGLNTDTHSSIQKTIDFMMSNFTENMNLYPAMAYPGSPLYLHAKQKGYELPSTYEEWGMFSYETKNLPTDTLTAAEVLRYRDEAWKKYFTNPEYHKWMEGKFGKKCVDDIISITKIPLKRKLLGD